VSEGQVSKTYDFNSVGELDNEFQSNLLDPLESIPVGIKTPMELANDGTAGPFKMRSDLGEQIRDNFRNMLATNHGDRIMLFDFGANLEELTFELGTESSDTEAIRRIQRTTSKYMPFIALETFEPIRQPDLAGNNLAFIGILVRYNVPQLNLNNQAVEIILYTAG